MTKRANMRPARRVLYRPRPGQRRVLPWVLSGAAHVAVFAALFWPHAASPPSVEPQAIPVTVVTSPAPEPPGPPAPAGPPGPPAAAAPQAIAVPAPKSVPRPASPRLAIAASLPPVDAAPVDDNSDVLNASQIAGAISAEAEGGGGGGGAGGGGCDTAQIVQQALRRDPLVHTAVAGANRLGKSVMLWNGDWVRSGIQDGKGLSAVREAIVWELAFSPPACRDKRVHGMVLLSLADGNTRFAIGANDWRWSDLLEVR